MPVTAFAYSVFVTEMPLDVTMIVTTRNQFVTTRWPKYISQPPQNTVSSLAKYIYISPIMSPHEFHYNLVYRHYKYIYYDIYIAII